MERFGSELINILWGISKKNYNALHKTSSCPLIRHYGMLFWNENEVCKQTFYWSKTGFLFSQLEIIIDFHPKIT